MLRWIDDIPRSAAMNMAIDEMLFNRYGNEPVLRVYYWDSLYTTIGYFQKAENATETGFVRRFTGGLAVTHLDDISYGFIVSSDFWNVYSQRETYRNIHSAVQKTLRLFGVDSVILDKKIGNTGNICIQTFYENDLIAKDRKIAGSCLRRRGGKIIVQGSVHVNLNCNNRKIFSRNFAKNIAEILKTEITATDFTNSDIESAEKIAGEKYLNSRWNGMF